MLGAKVSLCRSLHREAFSSGFVSMRSIDEKSVEAGSSTASRALAAINGIARLLGRLQRRDVATPPRTDTQRMRDAERERIGLEAEVRRLSRERAVARVENQLLHEMAERRDPASAAEALLRRLVPERTDEFAVVLDVTQSPPQVIAARGLTSLSKQSLRLSSDLLEQLQQQSWLPLRANCHASGTLVQSLAVEADACHSNMVSSNPSECDPHLLITPDLDDGHAHVGTRKVWCIGLRNGANIEAVLMTSCLFLTATSRDEQLGLLVRIGQSLAAQIALDRELRQRDEELIIFREMLDLRAIADGATEQPMKTLGRFAARLRESIGVEGIAIFLMSRRTDDASTPVVYSRKALPESVVAIWQSHESKLARYAMTSQSEHDFDSIRLRTIGIETLIGSARVWPLLHDGRLLGTVVLTQRSHAVIEGGRARLLGWSMDLLAVTLCRVFNAAVMRRLARNDGLTDLTNRRTFDALLAGEVERVRLGLSHECSLLMLDLDRFKSINDTHGHPAGDEVLRVVAQLLREHVGRMRVGEQSVLARYGGEELAVLLPGVGLAGALRLAEELRAAIEARVILFQGKTLRVTMSIGVACCPNHCQSTAGLVSAADDALYRAKSAGRNCVCQPINSVCLESSGLSCSAAYSAGVSTSHSHE